MRRAIIASIILLVPLTGCSRDDESTPPVTEDEYLVDDKPDDIQTPEGPCGKDCSNQEVTDSGCDAGSPRSAEKPVEVTDSKLGGVRGVLELRMADPVTCDSIYWARFRPYADTSDKAWVVVIRAEGVPAEDQPSVPEDPTIDGFTEGVYVKPGSTVEYCLRVGKASACFEHEA